MQPSVDEYRASRKDAPEIAAQRKQLTLVAQATVVASNLTGLPEWDRFLSYIAAGSEACAEQSTALRDRIADPNVVDQGEIMRLKILLEGWIQRGRAFEAVAGLPKDLLEMGEQAKALLDRLPEAET